MMTAEEKLDGLAAQMNSMMKLMETFNRWHPDIDKFSTEISQNLKSLMPRVEALEAAPPSAPPQAPKREEEGWAVGHGAAQPTQGSDTGTLVLNQPLANGQYYASNSQIPESRAVVHYNYAPHNQEPRLPKAHFPKFDGSHPRVWKEKAGKYFDMFNVPVHRWAQYATIHFKGHAELWLQTYEAQHRVDS